MPPPAPPLDSTSASAAAYAALAFTIVIWGVAPAVVRSFSLLTGPADAIVIRSVTVSAFCLLCMPFLRGPRIAAADWPRLLVVSLLGMFGYFFGTIFGYAMAPTAVGGIITATQPLIIALLAAALGQDRLTPAAIAGLCVSFIGTLLLFGGGDMASGGSRLYLGAALLFLSGISWSIYVVMGKPLVQRYGALRITFWSQLLCTFPAIAFASESTLTTLQALDARGIAELIYLTIIGSVLTLATWNYALGRMPTVIVGASLYLIPLLAIAAGAVLLGEPVLASNLLAGAVILAGVAIAQFGGRLARRAPSA